MKTHDFKNKLEYTTLNKGVRETRTLDFDRILLLQTIVLLSLHDGVRQKVDVAFHTNKEQFQPFLVDDYLDSEDYFFSHPAEYAIAMKKILAIYQGTPESERYPLLRDWIKFGYKRFYDIATTTPAPFPIGKLFQLKLSIPEGEMGAIVAMTLYVRVNEGESIVFADDFFQNFIENAAVNNLPLKEAMENQYWLSDIDQKKAMKKYEEVIGKKIPKSQSLDELFDSIEAKALHLLNHKQKARLDYDKLYLQGVYRPFKAISTLFFVNGYHDLFMSYKVNYTRDDYYQFYAFYKSNLEKGRIHEDEFEFYFSLHLQVFALTKHYRNLYNGYIEELAKKDSIAIEQQQEALKQERIAFNTEKDKQAKEFNRIQNENDELKAYIQQLEKKLKDSETIIETQENYKEEVLELRNALFAQELAMDEDNDEVMDTTGLEKLQEASPSIALFGGQPKFVQRMKKYFPQLRVVSPEELHVDIQFVNNLDIILFDTSYNNHANYKRVRDALVSNKPVFIFINRGKSIERIADDIAEKFFV